jgi:predicted amidophosphoribosyltransferase
VAADWNFKFEPPERTVIGEAEYNLKYKRKEMHDNDILRCKRVLVDAIKNCLFFLPIANREKVLVTTIPSVKEKQDKPSWQFAKFVSKRLNAEFLAVTLFNDKLQMKDLSVDDKIETWRRIYSSRENLSMPLSVENREILIVDDFYQSGASTWSFAEYLKGLGAVKILGLAIVKSVKDSDNT